MTISKWRYLAVGLLTFACYHVPAAYAEWEQNKTYTLTVLHTNDHHGHFWQSKRGEYGLAAQKTLVDRIRQEVKEQGGSVLVLSGGDVNTGVPESDFQYAEPDFVGMNEIGYDAMAVGNHEFDNSLEIIRQQESWSKFPFLSANIYDKKSGERLFKPYSIFERQGLKIAVLGLTTDDTPRIGNEQRLAAMDFRDPKPEAKALIAELRKNEKPDIIIAATHMGHYEDGNHGSNAPGDVELARYLEKGDLDMIVGGHSQEPLCMEQVNVRQKEYVPGTACMPDNQNGIWIVQAHEWGKYVGRADFTFKNGQLTLSRYELIPVNLKKAVKQDDGKTVYVNYTNEIQQDPNLLSILEPYQKKGEAQLGVELGRSEIYLEGSRNIIRYQQTNMGQLILKGMMDRTDSQFGVVSSGAIRSSLDVGPITYSDVLTVQPFSNTVGFAEMTGKEIVDFLNVVANITPGSGGYPQFANIYFKLNEGKVSDVEIMGQRMEMDKTYRFAILSFNAKGGDGYPNIWPKFVDTGAVSGEVLKDYIVKKGVLTEKEFG